MSRAARNVERAAQTRTKFGVRTDTLGKLERTYQGRLYASKAEARFAAQLELLKRAGEILEWEPQPCPLRIVINKQYICAYTPDFHYRSLPDGEHVYVEIKGRDTAYARLKRKLIRACYPYIALRLVDSRTLTERPEDRRRKKEKV